MAFYCMLGKLKSLAAVSHLVLVQFELDRKQLNGCK